jgi:hypothetical protein
LANRIKTHWSKILTGATPWEGGAPEVDADAVRRFAGGVPLDRRGWSYTRKKDRSSRRNIKKAQKANKLRRRWKQGLGRRGLRRVNARRQAVLVRPRRVGAVQCRILQAMQPGVWYSRPELTRATGALVSGGLLYRFHARGWIEKGRNADWRPSDGRRWGERPPRYLWRITAAGELAGLI